jgi:hypothetical protein
MQSRRYLFRATTGVYCESANDEGRGAKNPDRRNDLLGRSTRLQVIQDGTMTERLPAVMNV